MKTFFVRFLCSLIPAKKLRKRIRRRLLDAARSKWLEKEIPLIRENYGRLADACRDRLRRGEKLRAAFVVCDASMFSGESVFSLMLDDPRFDPFVAVVPRVSRGKDFLRSSLAKTVSVLSGRYGGRVRRLYDPETGRAETLEGRADIVFTSIVYQDQTLGEFTTVSMSKYALTVCLYYGYGGLFRSNEKKTVFLPDIVAAWRYFVSNEATRKLWIERNPMLSWNTAVAGYCKMDRLAAVKPVRGGRRKIVIAPHHTIDKCEDALSLSTFPAHADFFLRLPAMFPEVDFVFRPHPLLFVRLATPKWWGEAKTREYVERMKAHSNVEFQQGGDYFETFASSDALVHDCGSFLAEYFYTGRPQCYLSDGSGRLERQLLPFSEKLYSNTYHAVSDDDIVRFIREVVIEGRDAMSGARAAFAAKEVCVNHPHASRAVLDAVVSSL